MSNEIDDMVKKAASPMTWRRMFGIPFKEFLGVSKWHHPISKPINMIASVAKDPKTNFLIPFKKDLKTNLAVSAAIGLPTMPGISKSETGNKRKDWVNWAADQAFNVPFWTFGFGQSGGLAGAYLTGGLSSALGKGINKAIDHATISKANRVIPTHDKADIMSSLVNGHNMQKSAAVPSAGVNVSFYNDAHRLKRLRQPSTPGTSNVEKIPTMPKINNNIVKANVSNSQPNEEYKTIFS